MPSLP